MILEQNQELFLAIQFPPATSGSQAFWVLDVMLLTYVKHQDVRCGGGSEQQKQQELVLIPPLPRCFGETGLRLSSRSHDECTRNQLVNHLLKDQEEDPKEAKTRVPLKQLRRKQKPLVKSDPEAGPENGSMQVMWMPKECRVDPLLEGLGEASTVIINI
ncbi:Hmga2 [Columba livia]|nr:Hmga2 [Columba livia]